MRPAEMAGKYTFSCIHLQFQRGFHHLPLECQLPALALPAQSKHHTCIPQVPDDKTRLSFAHQKLRLPQPRYLHIPDTLGLAAAVQLVFGVFCFRTAVICST